MRQLFTCIVTFFLLNPLVAQELPSFYPKHVVKWAPLGILPGNVSILYEHSLSTQHAITMKIGIPVEVTRKLKYQDRLADFQMRSFNVLIGYRTYFTPTNSAGYYIEPFFKYLTHYSAGSGPSKLNNEYVLYDFENRYEGTAVGLQLGKQILLSDRLVLDVFLGPELNSALNRFKAVEVTHERPWTEQEANEAGQTAVDFVENFPFVNNKVDVTINQNSRTIDVNFLGLLPGIRAGVAIGICF